ncbi:MAG: sugar phosphate isomerase/epimerase family protein [Terriglobia bacterium]|jgi:sugar phosphate isomerase/epimerase
MPAANRERLPGRSWGPGTRRQFLSLIAGATSTLVALPGIASALPSSFKLGIITDEISEELDQALDFITHYSLGYCEVREMWQKNVMSLSREELNRAKTLIARHGLRVSSIASPIFKYALPEMPAHPDGALVFHSTFTESDSSELLRKSFEIAHFFGTDKIRVFSYWRVAEPEKAYPYVRDRLAKAADLAARNGIILMVENEYDCNVGSAKELGRILRDVNSPHLRANWDLANAAMMNDIPFPNGYREVAGLVSHVHVKDVKRDPASGQLTWAPVGSGIIDWPGQLKALQEAQYTGTLSLETHFRPNGDALENARASIEGLLKIIRRLS